MVLGLQHGVDEFLRLDDAAARPVAAQKLPRVRRRQNHLQRQTQRPVIPAQSDLQVSSHWLETLSKELAGRKAPNLVPCTCISCSRPVRLSHRSRPKIQTHTVRLTQNVLSSQIRDRDQLVHGQNVTTAVISVLSDFFCGTSS